MQHALEVPGRPRKHEVGSDVDGFSFRDDRYKTRVIDLARE